MLADIVFQFDPDRRLAVRAATDPKTKHKMCLENPKRMYPLALS
jgi:hypothetical protein